MSDSNLDPKPNPSSHRTDSKLKPKKTTRTMNPSNKSTLKHSSMLSNVPKNLYSKVNTRSASRGMDDLERDDRASESVEGIVRSLEALVLMMGVVLVMDLRLVR